MRYRNTISARHLRKRPTRTEELLWQRLPNRQLDGLKFRRQHPFGSFVMDFYCDELALAVEIDGGIHSMHAQMERDAVRQQIIEEYGINFLRVSDEDVEQHIEEVLSQVLAWRTLTPGPFRAPAGEGN